MSATKNITEFSKGEFIVISVLAKDRDGEVLTSPGSQTLSMTFSLSENGDPLYEFDTNGSEIVLTDSPTALFTVSIPSSSIPALNALEVYYYNIWTSAGPGLDVVQAKGEFVLGRSVVPT